MYQVSPEVLITPFTSFMAVYSGSSITDNISTKSIPDKNDTMKSHD